jgi:hypothetical protein
MNDLDIFKNLLDRMNERKVTPEDMYDKTGFKEFLSWNRVNDNIYIPTGIIRKSVAVLGLHDFRTDHIKSPVQKEIAQMQALEAMSREEVANLTKSPPAMPKKQSYFWESQDIDE